MMRYKCPTCGKAYNPERENICPRCGQATPPSVTTQIERRKIARWLRSEGSHSYDHHCHDDDAWAQSTEAAAARRAAVRSHEASLRAGYASHQAVDNPTRVSNANAARQTNAAPAARPMPKAGKASKKTNTKLNPGAWVFIAWLLYMLFRLFTGSFD